MQRYGCSDNDGISPFLKVAITTEDGALQVMGYIGDGASWSMVSSWESPFENANLGSIAGLSTAAAAAQSFDFSAFGVPDFMQNALGLESAANLQGMTSISTMNSMMVWEGARPPAISLPVHFVAREDAAQEVQGALLALNQMISPELSAATPGGRRPQKVIVNVGRMVALTGCVITAVNMELDAPRTPDGYFTHNTVSLEISGSIVLNGSVMPQVVSMYPI
ncbi:TPA: hypothetical protein JG832_002495 [Enterobacter hormaechei subsp. xiangfangensis]|nr:hypothetical protein [Enterobacter hormaechei subsp. xiangfangensis]HAV1890630.1 hypothetical protein [Enterobacter hormaechei subsp. xiangfangensis]